ncbi:MAG: hypothetical protein J7494_00935 [Sphingobium sp.]|nr:hypothetical protein [Sphingobium sp.]
MSKIYGVIAIVVLCGLSAVPAQGRDQNGAAAFAAAADGFTSCLTATVRMGMTTKMDPAKFKEGFAKSCKAEEEHFRGEAIKFAMANGRAEAAAIAEVDGNIANGRRIFAADQEKYVTSGVVPR